MLPAVISKGARTIMKNVGAKERQRMGEMWGLDLKKQKKKVENSGVRSSVLE